MSLKKIFTWLVAAPMGLAFLNFYLASPVFFSWGNDHSKLISLVALCSAILGSILLIVQSFKLGSNFAWRILGIILVFVFLTWFYLGLNFNFGF